MLVICVCMFYSHIFNWAAFLGYFIGWLCAESSWDFIFITKCASARSYLLLHRGQCFHHCDELEPHAQHSWLLSGSSGWESFHIVNLSETVGNATHTLISVFLIQIAKLSIAPVVCVMEMIFRDKHFSREVKMSVVIVVLGVGICTVTDVRVNAQGFICACVAVAATAWQQIVSFHFLYTCIYFFFLLCIIWRLINFQKVLTLFNIYNFCHFFSLLNSECLVIKLTLSAWQNDNENLASWFYTLQDE